MSPTARIATKSLVIIKIVFRLSFLQGSLNCLRKVLFSFRDHCTEGTMHSHLERLRQELEEAMASSSVGVVARPSQGQWNPDEIAEHLFLTYNQTRRSLEKCLENGSPTARGATLKDRIATFLVIKLGYLPNGRKSPDRVLPRGMSSEEVRLGLAAELQKMDSELNACERRFGRRTKILDHPVLGPLTADEWRKFHLVHGRHHVRQIRARTDRFKLAEKR